jgi:iron(III) transport system substrate-binding protein
MHKSWLLVILFILSGCTLKPVPSVVIYTSVDQPYSEPIFNSFEQQSGIRVLAVYDIEAAKTTGLVSRLSAEQQKPQADVFWSSEIAQTLWLEEQGILASYISTSAVNIPAQFMDPHGYWTGLGYRARVIIVNTERVASEDYPQSLIDLLNPKWGYNEVGLANPLFGTMTTHAAALYAAWGPQPALDFFRALQDQGIRIVDGNSVVRDLVANGDLKLGLTDTDDAFAAVQAGKPVAVIFPDQGGPGTLAIPNTVALVAGGPNPVQGQALIDYLLSQDVETQLIQAGFLYGSLRTPKNNTPVMMPVSWEEVARQIEPAKTELQEIFLR